MRAYIERGENIGFLLGADMPGGEVLVLLPTDLAFHSMVQMLVADRIMKDLETDLSRGAKKSSRP
jgi:hypothetical protein